MLGPVSYFLRIYLLFTFTHGLVLLLKKLVHLLHQFQIIFEVVFEALLLEALFGVGERHVV